MPRLSRFQIMQHMKSQIIDHFNSTYKKNIFTYDQLKSILKENREIWTLPKITTTKNFIDFLKDKKIIEEVVVTSPQREIRRFVFGKTSPYEIALSLRPKSYLSHYTAVMLHQLTENVPKAIFTNLEQSAKPKNTEEMQQENIDKAFSRPMRKTNQIAYFNYNNKEYKVYLLNGKQCNKAGVERAQPFGLSSPAPITNLERTLLDITVRPHYCGGVEEVLNAYIEAKGLISVNRLSATLRKMDYKYPYHQSVGFYLEQAGYDDNILKLLEMFEVKHNFYLTYQIDEDNKAFSSRWKVYYPQSLIEQQQVN